MKTILYSILLTLLTTSLWANETFTLRSSELGGQITNKQVFNGFGHSGKNISPALSWANAPKNTKSFAITFFDPDAPTGSGWWHWVVYNVPAGTKALVSDAGNKNNKNLPKGAIQALNNFGFKGYGGAAPPQGKPHAYILTIYALDTEKLELPKDAQPALVGFMLNAHTIAKASIISYYQHPKSVKK